MLKGLERFVELYKQILTKYRPGQNQPQAQHQAWVDARAQARAPATAQAKVGTNSHAQTDAQTAYHVCPPSPLSEE